MKMIDSHAHIFGEFLYPRIDEIIESAKNAGIEKILAVCLTTQEARRALQFAENETIFDIAVGYYPNDILKCCENDFKELEELVTHDKIVAVGEIGLDYFSDDVPHEIQKEAFIRQMELAEKVNKPILVHNRLAADDTLSLMKKHCKTGGIMHCYSAGYPYLQEFMNLNMYFSFSGNITFEPEDEATQKAVREVPMERLLIETDAPNLTPVPVRNLENEPAYVSYVADYICKQRKIDKETLTKALWNNYNSLFLAR
ncbi:MAG: TatD family hydrolase [Lachnotalea sp.]